MASSIAKNCWIVLYCGDSFVGHGGNLTKSISRSLHLSPFLQPNTTGTPISFQQSVQWDNQTNSLSSFTSHFWATKHTWVHGLDMHETSRDRDSIPAHRRRSNQSPLNYHPLILSIPYETCHKLDHADFRMPSITRRESKRCMSRENDLHGQCCHYLWLPGHKNDGTLPGSWP
jgi:hypothetical protein